jgi:hypothetical protein
MSWIKILPPPELPLWAMLPEKAHLIFPAQVDNQVNLEELL